MDKLDIGVQEIARGAELSLRNALDLEKEASLLTSQGLFSRALFLHQISMEECAKIDMLGAWAASQLTGMSINRERLEKALSRHKAKNFANAYFIEATQEEREARETDHALARSLFKNAQSAFHEKANTRKNASLYVDFENGRFVSPSERITEDMVHEIAEKNTDFLRRSEGDVRLLTKWAAEPKVAKEQLMYLSERLESLRELRPQEQMAALDALMNAMLAKLRTEAAASDGNDIPSGGPL